MILIDAKDAEQKEAPKPEDSVSVKTAKERAKAKSERMMTHEKSDRLKRAGVVK